MIKKITGYFLKRFLLIFESADNKIRLYSYKFHFEKQFGYELTDIKKYSTEAFINQINKSLKKLIYEKQKTKSELKTLFNNEIQFQPLVDYTSILTLCITTMITVSIFMLNSNVTKATISNDWNKAYIMKYFESASRDELKRNSTINLFNAAADKYTKQIVKSLEAGNSMLYGVVALLLLYLFYRGINELFNYAKRSFYYLCLDVLENIEDEKRLQIHNPEVKKKVFIKRKTRKFKK